jgi:hypothetical protein
MHRSSESIAALAAALAKAQAVLLPIGEPRRYRDQGAPQIRRLAALPNLWVAALRREPPPSRLRMQKGAPRCLRENALP